MSNRPRTDWNPRDVSALRDQQRAYDEMRERCPVAYNDSLGWSLFDHQDIASVLADPETYRSASPHRAVPAGMDPPEHTRYRRVLELYFRPDQMRAFAPRCRRIAVDLLPSLIGRDEVEGIAAFAQPFAFKTLCAFLGWPAESWENLRGWAHGNQAVAFSRDKEAGAALAREFTGYVTEALRVRREAGVDASDDLITHLMKTAVEGTALSDDDIVSLLRNFTAGHGTVAAALGILVYYLAEHTDRQQQLRHEPALLPAAIDEILRADGPLVANRRTTARAVEIGGRKIAAGEKLSLNWIAGNRDGRVFDAPDAVRFDRDPENNLLFGAGIHYCLGAPLARLEMRVAMEELLTRTTMIELGATETRQRDISPSNGFRVMPVRLR